MKMKLITFDKEKIFAEVDKSNKRFDNYTPEQRKEFRDIIRKMSQNELYGKLGRI